MGSSFGFFSQPFLVIGFGFVFDDQFANPGFDGEAIAAPKPEKPATVFLGFGANAMITLADEIEDFLIGDVGDTGVEKKRMIGMMA